MSAPAVVAPAPSMVQQAAPPPKPQPPKLKPTNFKLAEFATQRWCAVLDPKIPYERLFAPDFWAHIASMVKPCAIIEVHAEDGAFFAELYVRASHKTGLLVQELRKVSLDGEAAPEAVKLTAEFKGPVRMWSVMRGKEIVQDKFATREDAESAIVIRAREFAA